MTNAIMKLFIGALEVCLGVQISWKGGPWYIYLAIIIIGSCVFSKGAEYFIKKYLYENDNDC